MWWQAQAFCDSQGDSDKVINSINRAVHVQHHSIIVTPESSRSKTAAGCSPPFLFGSAIGPTPIFTRCRRSGIHPTHRMCWMDVQTPTACCLPVERFERRMLVEGLVILYLPNLCYALQLTLGLTRLSFILWRPDPFPLRPRTKLDFPATARDVSSVL
ncbi:hypothetical protein BJV78DRAFT_1242318 [Lactifluus subvellereus]|nr:hypothetical protein BJV78DRAFT_1242318 [Lactifluus subvellereus]